MITLTLFCLLLKAAGFVLKLLWLAFGVVAYGALLFLGLCLNAFTVPAGLIACKGWACCVEAVRSDIPSLLVAEGTEVVYGRFLEALDAGEEGAVL